MNAVVIGSGVGGLVAANLLAMRGWTVTVLEQHTRPGGFLHRFFRAGVGYDTGFHYVGSAGRDQLFGRVLTHLGVYDRLELRPLDPDGFDELRFPGFRIRVPVGLDRWEARLAAAFPHEQAGLADYFAAVRAAVGAYGLYNLDLARRADGVLPWEERTVADVLDGCVRDPILRAVLAAAAVLYGVPVAEAPFGLHATVTDHYCAGAWTIAGGGDRLAKVLVQALRARGGTLVLRARVDGIDVGAGAAHAVRTADGRVFPADLVVSDLHPALTAELVPAGALRPVWVDRVTQARTGVAHVGAYLRVRGDLRGLAGHNLYRFASFDPAELPVPVAPGRVPFYFLTAPGARDAPVPGAEQVVLALGLADWDEWAPLATDAAAYARKKAEVGSALVDTIQADFPHWAVDVAELSTPLTTRRFTGARNGAIYGHYHSVEQMGRYRFGVRTRLPNLLHVGHAVGFPGICGAAMTGYLAVGEVVGLDGLVEELKSA